MLAANEVVVIVEYAILYFIVENAVDEPCFMVLLDVKICSGCGWTLRGEEDVAIEKIVLVIFGFHIFLLFI